MAVACVAEVLLVVLGVFGEVVLHHIATLVVAGVFAVLLCVVIPVYRRLGLI